MVGLNRDDAAANRASNPVLYEVAKRVGERL
jgi:hypothetical protein